MVQREARAVSEDGRTGSMHIVCDCATRQLRSIHSGREPARSDRRRCCGRGYHDVSRQAIQRLRCCSRSAVIGMFCVRSAHRFSTCRADLRQVTESRLSGNDPAEAARQGRCTHAARSRDSSWPAKSKRSSSSSSSRDTRSLSGPSSRKSRDLSCTRRITARGSTAFCSSNNT